MTATATLFRLLFQVWWWHRLSQQPFSGPRLTFAAGPFPEHERWRRYGLMSWPRSYETIWYRVWLVLFSRSSVRQAGINIFTLGSIPVPMSSADEGQSVGEDKWTDRRCTSRIASQSPIVILLHTPRYLYSTHSATIHIDTGPMSPTQEWQLLTFDETADTHPGVTEYVGHHQKPRR